MKKPAVESYLADVVLLDKSATEIETVVLRIAKAKVPIRQDSSFQWIETPNWSMSYDNVCVAQIRYKEFPIYTVDVGFIRPSANRVLDIRKNLPELFDAAYDKYPGFRYHVIALSEAVSK